MFFLWFLLALLTVPTVAYLMLDKRVTTKRPYRGAIMRWFGTGRENKWNWDYNSRDED